MKIRHIILAIISYFCLYYMATSLLNPRDFNIQIPQEKLEINQDEDRVMVKVNDEYVPLEEYVVRVVASEMPANFEVEALKAQAVAARSFVASRSFVVGSTTASQVCKTIDEIRATFKDDYDKKMAKIQAAVDATKDEIMIYNGKIVNALYFSTSNGYTVNADEYYTAKVDYLKEVASSWDLSANPNAIMEKWISNADIIKAFSLKGTPVINIIERYDNNRVKRVNINGKDYSGREVREALSLRSTDFTLVSENGGFTFKTVGYGHGVGMSQYGANGMAGEGYNYQDILKHYYQNVEIIKYSMYKSA